MGTLYNEDNTGNQTVGTIGSRTIAQIQKNVLPFNYVSGTATINAVTNNQYVIEYGGSWTLNMPSGAQAGDRVKVTTNFGGGTIQFAGGNYLIFATRSTTLGGSISTSDEGAIIEMVCDFDSGQVEWSVESVTGNWLATGSPTNFDINAINDYTNDGNGNKSSDFRSRQLVAPNGSAALDYSVNGIVNCQSSAMQALGFQAIEGSNAKQGIASLSSGSVVVNNTSVTANSRIFLTIQSPLGSVGSLYVSTRTPGTSFTVASTNGADASTFAYEIFEPA